MKNLITSSILRYSARKIYIKKCSLPVNLYKNSVPAFLIDDNFSSQRTTKYLLSNTFSSDNSKKKIISFSGNNKSYSYYCQSELKSGFLKNGLFKNSLRLPVKLNVRFESTSSAVAVTDSLSDVANEVSETKFKIQDESFDDLLENMSGSPLVNGSQELLEFIHNYTGLPWWGTVLLTAIVVKSTIYLPFCIQQRRAIISLENAHKAFNENMSLLREEITMSMQKFGWPADYSRTKFREMMKVIWKDALKQEKTHPVKAVLCVSVQFTTWLAMTLALGKMCCVYSFTDPANIPVYFEMATGGIERITNLTVPDSSLLLPISVSAINLSIVGIHYVNYRGPTIMQKFTCGTFALLSLGTIPLLMHLPSGIALYWLSSSSYGLVFNLILLTRVGKYIFKIPDLKTDCQLKDNAKDKFPEFQETLHSNQKDKKLKQKLKEI